MADILSLAFALRVPGESRTGGLRSALTREHDVRGLASVRGAELVLEWSGTTRVAALASIRRRGWWWRPRVELRVAELDALRGVPGAEGPLLALIVGRADLECAGGLVLRARAGAPALRDSGARRPVGPPLAVRPAPVHYRSAP